MAAVDVRPTIGMAAVDVRPTIGHVGASEPVGGRWGKILSRGCL